MGSLTLNRVETDDAQRHHACGTDPVGEWHRPTRADTIVGTTADVRMPRAAFAKLADETSERWYAQFVSARG